MDLMDDYGRAVHYCVGQWNTTPQNLEDFKQDAYLKIIELKQKYPEQFENGSGKMIVNRAVLNLMIDHKRREKTKAKHFEDYGHDAQTMIHQGMARADDQNIKSPVSTKLISQLNSDRTKSPFSSSYTKELVRELCRLLPAIDRKVLMEMIEPSEGFRWFLKQRNAIHRLYKKRTGIKLVPRGGDLCADPAIAEFLHIPPKKFKEIVKNITFVANRIYSNDREDQKMDNADMTLTESQNDGDCFGVMYNTDVAPCRDKCELRFLCKEQVSISMRRYGEERFREIQEQVARNSQDSGSESTDMQPAQSETVAQITKAMTDLGLRVVHKKGYIAAKSHNRNIFSITKAKAKTMAGLVKFNSTLARDEFPQEIIPYVSQEKSGGCYTCTANDIDTLKKVLLTYMESLS